MMTDSALSIVAILTQSPTLPLWVYKVPGLVFAFCFGACVGSFLNVVVYRLPAGVSIITPPSRCPRCGWRLTWRENFPILGWLWLRGKCRKCRAPISAQYMIVELMMALLFLALAWLFYVVPPATAWWSEVAGPWWYWNGVKTVPLFIAVLVLAASLVGMTMIDARTFTIQIELPMAATLTGFVAVLVQAIIQQSGSTMPRTWQAWPMPLLGPGGTWACFGGMIGIVIAWWLLRRGTLPRSFSDYDQFVAGGSGARTTSEADDDAPESGVSTAEVSSFELLFGLPVLAGLLSVGVVGLKGAGAVSVGVMIAALVVRSLRKGGMDMGVAPSGEGVLADDYPHARREMKWEVLFLLPCLLGLLIGWAIGVRVGGTTPFIMQAMGGAFAGYLVGGGVVWGIRILGTLGFGREAMGMGDVHLLAAVGAVLGWRDAALAMFAAAFIGLAWAIIAALLQTFIRGVRREAPFGPHLAIGAAVVFLLRPEINTRLWPQIEQAWRNIVG